MTYLLDTNVFITAKNLHYGFDFCPAFWDWLILKNKEQKVFSIKRVYDEINKGHGDNLSDWAKGKGYNLFLKPEKHLPSALDKVAQFIASQNFEEQARKDFFETADYYLIAHAHQSRHIIVTHESRSDSIKKVKIPNICIGLGIKFMNPFEMLTKEEARFVLGNKDHQ